MTSRALAVLGTLGVTDHGFDLNQPLTAVTAPKWKAHGYTFVDRYIWRDHQRPYDLSIAEIEVILAAGLALTVTQHYAGDGWRPNASIGGSYGRMAVQAANSLELPSGLTLTCDLEGCDDDVSAIDVVEYGAQWAHAVADGGFLPQLYVGQGCVLLPHELGDLPFPRFRRALNLNTDQYPTGRGFCVFQHEAKPADIPDGVAIATSDFDTNTITGDRLGGFPTALIPQAVTV